MVKQEQGQEIFNKEMICNRIFHAVNASMLFVLFFCGLVFYLNHHIYIRNLESRLIALDAKIDTALDIANNLHDLFDSLEEDLDSAINDIDIDNIQNKKKETKTLTRSDRRKIYLSSRRSIVAAPILRASLRNIIL